MRVSAVLPANPDLIVSPDNMGRLRGLCCGHGTDRPPRSSALHISAMIWSTMRLASARDRPVPDEFLRQISTGQSARAAHFRLSIVRTNPLNAAEIVGIAGEVVKRVTGQGCRRVELRGPCFALI